MNNWSYKLIIYFVLKNDVILPYSMAYGIRKFIAAVANDRHWALSSARSSQFSLQTLISPRSLLILSSQRRLNLPNGLFPSSFPPRWNIVYVFLPSELHIYYS